jgi:hypothetical protein
MDVYGRWNSCHDMCANALRIKKELTGFSIQLVSTQKEKSFSYIDNSDWETLTLIVELLEPFKQTTLDLSGDYFLSRKSTRAFIP